VQKAFQHGLDETMLEDKLKKQKAHHGEFIQSGANQQYISTGRDYSILPEMRADNATTALDSASHISLKVL